MKINRATLVEAIAPLVDVASRRTTLPILACVKLESDGKRLTASASNCELYREVFIECEGELEPTCVNAAMLNGVARRSSAEFLTIETSGKRLKIEGGLTAELPTLPAKEFVERPPADGKQLPIDGTAVAEGINATAWSACDPSEHREALEAVCVVAKGGTLDCVALNGRTMARYSADTDADCPAFLVKSSGAPEFASVSAGPNAKLFASDNWLCAQNDVETLFLKRTEHEYANWRQLIPQNYSMAGSFDRGELLKAIESAILFTTAAQSSTVLAFNKSGVEVSYKNSEHCFSTTVPGSFGELRMAVDGRLFQKLLRSFSEDSITIRGVDRFSPLCVEAGNSAAFIMGMTLPN